MRIPKPVICTLNGRELKNRGARWRRALRHAGGRSELRADGLAFALYGGPAALDEIRKLIALEEACCAWMSFDLDTDGDRGTLTITSESAEGVRTIQSMDGLR